MKHVKRLPYLIRLVIIGAVGLATISLFIGSGSDLVQIWFANLFPSDNVLVAKVVSVQEATAGVDPATAWLDTVGIKFLTGSGRGQQTIIHDRGLSTADPAQRVRVGETIIVAKNTDYQGDAYYMTDRYRLPALAILALIFVLAVLILGGVRGFTSLLGLSASMAVLFFFVVPNILGGHDPLFISFVGAVIIAVISLYLAHGFNRRTTIALAGTLITLGIALGLTIGFTSFAGLLGLSTEAGFYLRLNIGTLNLRGLLLAGIIIGMLGVLDDVTVGQATTVEEIKRADPKLGFAELYRRGLTVGREHIASLVNTLVLAYAGVALPLFLLLIVQAQNNIAPLWLTVNSEPIAEEIVRTLVGSLALVCAVPITTLLAAYCYGKAKVSRW
ncbi:MAG TPA: YibE/F family protein [Candidatus Paceibacterota bacterium]|nr:YibE/F family protein [Candidatus Paceibacterota bacterium]